jgi:hypothetical protein
MKHLLSKVIVLGATLIPGRVYAETLLAHSPAEVYVAERAAVTGAGMAVDTLAMRAWRRSLMPVVISQSFDVSSSFGMRELNPMLAGSDGRFGAKAATIKAGTTAAMIGVEYLIIKKWPSTARILTRLNWGSSALTGAFAMHNYSIR